MNVLILTPDRVGSTLLQRLLTVYMLRRGFDQPVINLHELTNGLIKYFNPTLNQDVLGKPEGSEWGYYQTLDQIVDLLNSVDHYKTSRLAHYHIVNRQDTVADQIKFYNYLNKNFYIISCRRENILEHALSWAIQAHSKKLNVYSPMEKVSAFSNIYQTGITVSQDGLVKYLNKYKEYLLWSDNYFNIQSYFNYDDHITDVEKYILDLDFMRNSNNNTWKDMFGQSFQDYNTCHRLLPNLVLQQTAGDQHATIDTRILDAKTYAQLQGPSWPAINENFVKVSDLPEIVQKEIADNFNMPPMTVNVSQPVAEFLNTNIEDYKDTTIQINELVETGFLVTGMPIKLQSLQEKKAIIRNFKDCVLWYNQWVSNNNIGKHYTEHELDSMSTIEEQKLNASIAAQLTSNISGKFLSS